MGDYKNLGPARCHGQCHGLGHRAHLTVVSRWEDAKEHGRGQHITGAKIIVQWLCEAGLHQGNDGTLGDC